MTIELKDFSVEETNSQGAWAIVDIVVDGCAIEWIIHADKECDHDKYAGWVGCYSGIGHGGQGYDISSISDEDKSFLFGERTNLEFLPELILDLEDRIQKEIGDKLQAIAKIVYAEFLEWQIEDDHDMGGS